MQARTAALNQLSAVLVSAPDQVRERLGGLSGERLAQAAARLRSRPGAMSGVLRRLGQRVARLSQEVAEAERALAEVVAEMAPELLEECGVDRSAAPSCSSRAATPTGCEARHPPPRSPVRAFQATRRRKASWSGDVTLRHVFRLMSVVFTDNRVRFLTHE
jgi:hypothetical protein